MDLKRLLALIPVIGAPFRDGESKSEYDIAVAAIGAILATSEPAARIAIGIVAAVYIASRVYLKAKTA